jgi:hypothetical protein
MSDVCLHNCGQGIENVYNCHSGGGIQMPEDPVS